jgi:hypothetical protein
LLSVEPITETRSKRPDDRGTNNIKTESEVAMGSTIVYFFEPFSGIKTRIAANG